MMHQQSSSKSTAIAASTLVPTQLRYALRLVHCLQKERGASSSLYAAQLSNTGILGGIAAALAESQGSISIHFLETTMTNAREGTDAAFINFLSLPNYTIPPSRSSSQWDEMAYSSSPRPWEESLRRVRACVDGASSLNNNSTTKYDNDSGNIFNECVNNDHKNDNNDTEIEDEEAKVISNRIVGSHRVVVMFNILIGNIIDEAVMQIIKKELQNLNMGKSGVSRIPAFRASSMIMNDTTRHTTNLSIGDSLARSLPLYENVRTPPPPASRKLSGSADGIDEQSRKDPNIEINNSDHNFNFRSSDCSSSVGGGSSNSAIDSHIDNEYKIPLQRDNTMSASLIINSEGDKDKIRVQYMLSTLQSFVRLKESIGLERAIICNLMATNRDKNHHSSSKLLTGLVVEDANQRMIIRELQSQSKKITENRFKLGDNMSNLLVLLDEMLRPGKEMERLQEMLRTNFNLEQLRKAMPFKQFWQVISIYIDKLHSMEMLLIEELQSRWMQFSITKSMGNSLSEKKRNLSQGSFSSMYASFNSETDREKQQLYNILLGRDKNQNVHEKLSDKDIARKISEIPADQIKRLLLSHFNNDGDGDSDSSTIPLTMTPQTTNINPIYENFGVSSHLKLPQNLHEWEIDLYEVDFKKRIGRGVGGTTYLATWSGQNVAVKVAATTDLGLEGWHAEVVSLQRLHHPNVIRLLGSIYNPSPQTYGLVLEYCESGDLSTALKRLTPSNFFWRVAEDVANGMNYLHRKNILHRDIKPGNVLLNGNVADGSFTAKLSDFGVAIMHRGSVGEEHTAETGTYRWMPPEIIRHESYSYAADVYSYALVIWQLVTHEIPFKNFSQIEAAGKVAVEYARPPFPQGTPELIISLISTCWRENPDERLSFSQIGIELKEIFKVLSDRERIWLSSQDGHSVYDLSKRTDTSSESFNPSIDGNTSNHRGRSKSEKKRRDRSRSGRGFLRSKSPNHSGRSGGLFSIFSGNRNKYN